MTVFTQVSSDPSISLPTEFCLKGKRKRVKLDPPSNAKFNWAPKGSYRLETMLQTIKNLPDRSNLDLFCKEKGFAIYVLDDFSVHLMNDVRKAFLEKGYILVIIGNCFCTYITEILKGVISKIVRCSHFSTYGENLTCKF